jgi:hypothetical protein
VTGPCSDCGGHGCPACAYERECPGCGTAAPLRRSTIPAQEAAELGRTTWSCSRCGRLAEAVDGRLAMRAARA